MTLKQLIKRKLDNPTAIAVLGVGSGLRGDDAAGMLAAESLQKHSAKINKKIKFKVFLGETAPENFTGSIREFAPSHVIIIDSTEAGRKAGSVVVFDPDESMNASFSTHSLPLKVMSEYLRQEVGCSVVIIGIQPKSMKFGEAPTKEVKRAVKRVCDTIKEILQL